MDKPPYRIHRGHPTKTFLGFVGFWNLMENEWIWSLQILLNDKASSWTDVIQQAENVPQLSEWWRLFFTWNLLTCNYSSRLLSSKSKLETYLLSTAHVFDTITRSYGRLSRRCRPVNNTRKAGLRNRWQWISLHVSEFYSWFKFFVLSTCEVVWQSILLPHLCIIYYLKSFLVSFSRTQREIVELIPFHEIAEQ